MEMEKNANKGGVFLHDLEPASSAPIEVNTSIIKTLICCGDLSMTMEKSAHAARPGTVPNISAN
jgi:hypothetical protein